MGRQIYTFFRDQLAGGTYHTGVQDVKLSGTTLTYAGPELEAAAETENASVSDRLADAKDKASVAEAKLTVAMKLTTTSAAE